jgi:hypothetical protein
MERQEEQVELQREASAVGLLAAIFLIFLSAAVLIVGITVLPAVNAFQPVPPTSLPERNAE